MDCQKTTALFSEHFDRRLKGARLAEFSGHQETCSSCRSEWARFQRVFELVGSSGELGPTRPFLHPSEPPGTLPALSLRRGPGWRRAAMVASVLAALVFSNIVMFKLGKGDLSGGQERVEVPTTLTAGMVQPGGEALRRVTREKWRDHLDAVNVAFNQFSLVGPDAALQGNELVRGKLELLRPEGLLKTTPAEISFLGDAGRFAPEYVRSLTALTHALQDHAQLNPGLAPSYCIQHKDNRSKLMTLMFSWQRLMAELNSEASGNAWRTASARLAPLDGPGEAGALLKAEVPFLSADYDRANQNFQAFRVGYPHSALKPLARYMEYEALYRMRRFDEARQVVRLIRLPRRRVYFPSPIRLTIRDPRAVMPPNGTMTIVAGGVIRFYYSRMSRVPGLGIRPQIFRVEVPTQLAMPLVPKPGTKKTRRKL